MRPSHAAVVVAFALVSSAAASPAQGQEPAPAGQGYGDTSPSADVAAPAVSRTLTRAALLVALAKSAPAAAPNVAAARRAAAAAGAAAAMYEAGKMDYEAGYRAAADSEARSAIELAGLAISAAVGGDQGVTVASSAGDLASAAPVVTNYPTITAAGTGRMLRLSRYADVLPLPFGAILAGPPAPPIYKDSLPFGAIPVRW